MRAEVLREVGLKCSNPVSLPCTWDPARCVTHRRRPRWLDRLEAQDRTGEIRHNG